MATELTCPKCGTTYRGDAIDRLDTIGRLRGEVVERVNGLPCQFLACLCEKNNYGHAESSATGMPRPIGGDRDVIVTGAYRYHEIGRVVGRTATRVIVRIGAEDHRYVIETGREHGGHGRIESDELTIAVRIADELSRERTK